MTYTLGTAAKAVGKSKPTIQRAIKSGKVSAVKRDDGSYEIDPAELHRVFPPVTANGNECGEMKQSVTASETILLRAENENLREQIGRERETVSDLRRRLDQSDEDRRKAQGQLTALLTNQSAKATPGWIVGKIITGMILIILLGALLYLFIF